MPWSLGKIIVHVILSTKAVSPWLDDNVRPERHVYLATVSR